MKQKILTLRQLYYRGQEILKGSGIEEYQLDAWRLLEYAAGITRAAYYGEPDREIGPLQAEIYLEGIRRRSKRIPLQHITGEQEFMGYPFLVNQHVLIPRQDTEILVEEAVKRVKSGMSVLDMCTGSGCVLLSLLRHTAERNCASGIAGTGADISEEALAVARENGVRLHVEAEFTKSDLFEQVSGMYDMIVSNPPYIRTAVIRELQEEVRLHDPYIALDGKEDGLYFYRRIITEGVSHIKEGGWMLFEIGYDQAEAVAELLRAAGYGGISVKKDLAGLDRVVCARYNVG